MLDRREFMALAAASQLAGQPAMPEAIREAHFPNRVCQFVWRNWELANEDRMAKVLRTSTREVLKLGAAMGLPGKRRLSDDLLRRIYVTVIRQNWHLLPTEQLTQLLGWDEARLRFTLKEDDFLDVKLGRDKPRCEAVIYSPLTQAEMRAVAAMKRTVEEVFGASLRQRGAERMQFVAELSDSKYPALRVSGTNADGDVDLRDGWSVAPVGDARLTRAGERFLRYLRESFGAKTGGERRIVLLVSPEMRGWRTNVTAREIRVEGADTAELMQGLYSLQDAMEEREGPLLRAGTVERRTVWSPRFLYSYFALYGDPLFEPEADPFPDAYLEKLARAGINGVWLQAVLNTLAPSAAFPEFGKGAETRLKNLNALVQRAAEFGVKVYLYLNEPRAMPAEFFAKRPEMRGAEFQGLYSMCTSAPAVRSWIADTLAHVFGAAPELGGVFTISMSENHTNCFSHGGAWGVKPPNAGGCPRCGKRESWDALAELFRAMHEGVRRSSATAQVLHYDWGWPDEMTPKLVAQLPRDTGIISISEWSVPVEKGGVKTAVGEYSISVVGPGPRATRSWASAKAAGLTSLAKVQLNNTWEISAVPYIPVPQLIAEHCENLRRAGIGGLMAAWTCGGYPSPNLDVAKAYYSDPPVERGEVLLRVARQRYGRAGAEAAVAAWEKFSSAFTEFPYGVAVYVIPVQHGPANLLRLRATGHKPGMILFPHDGMKTWCGRYPPEVVEQQFTRMAAKWKEGLPLLEKAVAAARRRDAELDLAIARTCYHHFQSVANQVAFYRLREAGAVDKARMRELVRSEIALARAQFPVAREWSVIGYEASNHYYYTPLDLVEKVLNCKQILGELG